MIPYSLAYRLLRIESVPNNILTNLEKLGSELIKRGYIRKAIAVAFEKFKSLPRLPNLSKVQKPANDRPVLVIPFNKVQRRWQVYQRQITRLLNPVLGALERPMLVLNIPGPVEFNWSGRRCAGGLAAGRRSGHYIVLFLFLSFFLWPLLFSQEGLS